MFTTIIIENGASKQSVDSVISTARAIGAEVGSSDIILIARDRSNEAIDESHFISSRESSLSYCYKIAISKAANETILFMDASADTKPQDVRNLVKGITGANDDHALMCASLELGSETADIAELEAESLVSSLASNSCWPTLIFAARKSFVQGEKSLEGKSSNEIFVNALVAALAAGESIGHFEDPITLPDSNASFCQLTKAERARCLNRAVSGCNIEDLFPRHAWTTHQEESAAACYHTLAALFISLEDTPSAMECLALGDKLEDSPRSLALKGIIALAKGEMLGAVANMVSSLQQYELRKRNSERHYLSFSPQNLEAINVKLQAGLEALNKRDNQTALEHFAEAVFNFDDFYKAYGIDRVKAQA